MNSSFLNQNETKFSSFENTKPQEFKKEEEEEQKDKKQEIVEEQKDNKMEEKKEEEIEEEKEPKEFQDFVKKFRSKEWFNDFRKMIFRNPDRLSYKIKEMHFSDDQELKGFAKQLLSNPKMFAKFFVEIYQEQELINFEENQKRKIQDERRRRENDKKRRLENIKNKPKSKPKSSYDWGSYGKQNSYYSPKSGGGSLFGKKKVATKENHYFSQKVNETKKTNIQSFFTKKDPKVNTFVKPKFDESLVQTLVEFGVPKRDAKNYLAGHLVMLLSQQICIIPIYKWEALCFIQFIFCFPPSENNPLDFTISLRNVFNRNKRLIFFF